MARTDKEYSIVELEALGELDFSSLDNDRAAALGAVAVTVIQEWDLNLAVDIVLRGDLVFRAKLKSTGAGHDAWLAGKAAVAAQFGEPSLLVKNRHLEAGTDFLDLDLDHDLLKAYGGSIPLRVGGELVGTLTMSGETDSVDHEAAVEAITRHLRATQG